MLYKYLNQKRLDVIENLKIRFTQPKALNDPFEAMPLVDISNEMSPLINTIKQEAEQLWNQTDPTEQTSDNYQLLQKSVDNLVANANRMASGENSRIGSAVMEGLNQKIGILSLSKTIHNLLLWSHYADSHRGYAIGFDPDHPYFHALSELGTITHPNPVTYTTQRSFIRKNDHDLYTKMFCEKPIDWAYEEEFRIFRQFSDLTTNAGLDKADYLIYLADIPPDVIRSIYIGAQAGQPFKDRLVNTVSGHKIKASIFEMKFSGSEYRVEPYRIA